MISGWRPSLLALLDEVVLEDLHAPGLEVVASVEVAAEEGQPRSNSMPQICDLGFNSK